MFQTALSLIKDFIDAPAQKKVLFILSVIVAAFSYYYIESENEKKAAYRKMQKELQECKNTASELKELKNSLILFRATQDYLPIPYWVKSLSGKVLYVNNSYVKEYLEPMGLSSSDYIGSYDRDIWGSSIAKTFRTNDSIVLSLGKPVIFVEYVDKDPITVLKFPFIIGDITVGVAGVQYSNF